MSKKLFRIIVFSAALLWVKSPAAQTASLTGRIFSNGQPLPGVSVSLPDLKRGGVTDTLGNYYLTGIPFGSYKILVSARGFETTTRRIKLEREQTLLPLELKPVNSVMDEIVVSGTMRPVLRLESPVPVEIYTPQFLKKNPSPSIFESLQQVNGVRPQLNCNVCNTGDIHINGLEGPYTMITIDGMPIVSSLAAVYGLFGIPNQLIERIEIIKGPASGLYGSEAIGGLINIITKNPAAAPRLSADLMVTSWKEILADAGFTWKAGKKAHGMLGINYFNYNYPVDHNRDGFTDVTNQHRISLFNKWMLERPANRVASLAVRYFYEDRWGGEMEWNKSFRGTDSLYGESIYTNRVEVIGKYQLPIKEPVTFSWSYNFHQQDSYYGRTPYYATQHIAFGQLVWNKNLSVHDLLAGMAARYQVYDDNSVATRDPASGLNKPDKVLLPGIFIQDEIRFNAGHRLLAGIRYDYHPIHGSIFTPRIAYQWKFRDGNFIRLNAGTGFRVVNLFTEDHAALTGAREVVIREELKPEKSLNVNLNYHHRIALDKSFIGIDGSVWYTYFSNQIVPDYITNPNQIIYDNLHGYAISKGLSLNLEWNLANRLRALAGVTVQDLKRTESSGSGEKIRYRPLLVENWSGTWTISWLMPRMHLSLDYSGNFVGPMHLPLLGSLDPRPPVSPLYSIQNLQLTRKFGSGFEAYGGVKNFLNWTPAKSAPFIIARAEDPFDKGVVYGANGQVLPTPENPYALSFDPNYVYAPNQGIRIFLGMRFVMD